MARNGIRIELRRGVNVRNKTACIAFVFFHMISGHLVMRKSHPSRLNLTCIHYQVECSDELMNKLLKRHHSHSQWMCDVDESDWILHAIGTVVTDRNVYFRNSRLSKLLRFYSQTSNATNNVKYKLHVATCHRMWWVFWSAAQNTPWFIH